MGSDQDLYGYPIKNLKIIRSRDHKVRRFRSDRIDRSELDRRSVRSIRSDQIKSVLEWIIRSSMEGLSECSGHSVRSLKWSSSDEIESDRIGSALNRDQLSGFPSIRALNWLEASTSAWKGEYVPGPCTHRPSSQMKAGLSLEVRHRQGDKEKIE